MDKIRISTPLEETDIRSLKAGDRVLISGKIYTARDAAHLRLMSCIQMGKALPFDLEGQIIYYAGPSPARPGRVIGACGPTTSYRMDQLTIPLLELGLKGMVGKGDRDTAVIEGIINHGAIYFCAIGGAGALISSRIVSTTTVAYEDLGAEAIMCLEVEDFPVIVAIDSKGNDLYKTEPQKYRKEIDKGGVT